MEYVKEISEKIIFINQILDEIKVAHLFENSSFIIDEISMESWVKINLNNKGKNKISASFTLTLTGIEVRLDRIGEAIDWSNKDLIDSKEVIKKLLKNLLTNYILVEYYGPSLTYISLFGDNGKCNNIFKYIEGFPFKWKRQSKLYLPIVNKE